MFKSSSDWVALMIQDYKDITGVQLDPSDLSHEMVIKIRTIALALASFSSMQQKDRDDIWPGSASESGLVNHLGARQMPTRIDPQAAAGVIQLSGTPGSAIGSGVQAKRNLTGDIYIVKYSGVIGSGGTAQITFESLLTGQDYNIAAAGEAFTLLTTVTGVTSAGTSLTPFSDGRDLETPAEMLDRVTEHDQDLDTGGNLVAYARFAHAASPQVVTATPIKNNRGPSTVDTVITSGTTDIAAAVKGGQAVVRIPSSDLLAAVQAYIVTQNPTTDDHQTLAPTESAFNVTCLYNLSDESLRSAVDTQITQIIQIFLYSAASGATINPAVLERQIDQAVGHLLIDRKVSDFGSGARKYTIPAGQLLRPGTITLGVL